MLVVEDFYDAYRNFDVVDASPIVLDGSATKVLKLASKLARSKQTTEIRV